MKILLVTYWGLTNMGGIWTYMRQLADKLSEQGHSVTLMGSHAENNTLYLLDRNEAFDKKAYYTQLLPQLDSVRFPHLHLEHGIFSFELGRYVFEGGAAVLGLEEYDVIHAQDPIASYALRRIMRRRIPLVTSVHGALTRESFYEYKGLEPELTRERYESRPIWKYFRRMETLGARSADRILVSSNWIGGLTRDLGVDGERIHTLPYGVNLEQYAARAEEPSVLKISGGKRVIMFAGRLEYIKGVHVLIEALGILQKRCQDWVCVVAGIGSLLEELKEQAVRLGVLEQILFTGKLDNVPAALGDADIYVQPSLQDTQPFSVTEAQLAGIAPVVAGTAGMPEMVRHGETGWIVPPGDAARLAGLLEELLGDEELRVRTGFQAREWAAQQRSLDVMAAGTLAVYRKAIAMQSLAERPDPAAGQAAVSIPHAFHPADVLNGLQPGLPLADTLRRRLPQHYSIPDCRTALPLA
ncbi:glycosyltransferase family 4 protein [Paenibacillus sp. MMS20-IR301]|uniref:glycosyltransferase family 4 protein n=1 Tax=Paenibacillus sp. MMS20-IR301 TaxID=2895946 RepID=UPI0028E54A73|nr:glycosyltransferase family 4 protein [Paenibacillus sp. MMS20-IR301]WNS43576.1 glycosyltransferase family 4 protein [Paenibacillus sp. MMS20-IR301]